MLNLVSSRSDKVDMKKIYVISVMIFAAAFILAACSGDLTTPDTTSTYRVDAMLIKKLLPDSAAVFVTLQKNGSDYQEADIRLDGMILDTTFDGYVKYFGPFQLPSDSSFILNIRDGDSLDVDLTISIPEEFAIESPSVRHFTGSAESVSWSAAPSADGYILAAVPPETTFIYETYEAYTDIPEGAIPPDAFLDGQGEKILGKHSIYVAAYIGAPTFFFELPFEIPSADNPVDNVSGNDISGRVSGMVIAEPDSIFVTE
jgi:hypothetical protein